MSRRPWPRPMRHWPRSPHDRAELHHRPQDRDPRRRPQLRAPRISAWPSGSRALTRPLHHAQLEEWAHEHYFMTREHRHDHRAAAGSRARPRARAGAGGPRHGIARHHHRRRGRRGGRGRLRHLLPDAPDMPEALTPVRLQAALRIPLLRDRGPRTSRSLASTTSRRQEVNFRQIFHSGEAATAPKRWRG